MIERPEIIRGMGEIEAQVLIRLLTIRTYANDRKMFLTSE